MAFARTIVDDYQTREGVGPPPAEPTVQDNTDEYGGSKARVDERDSRLSLQNRVIEAPTGIILAPREREHCDERYSEPSDS